MDRLPVISAVSVDLLRAELARLVPVCRTRHAGNCIYDFTSAEAPYLMREVARLRELSFRQAGGATGQSLDCDVFDLEQPRYRQLIVWDPDNEHIVGGYRYIYGRHAAISAQGQPSLTMSHLYRFSSSFVTDYLPFTIEFGRAFVQPQYQHRLMGVKSLYALDNVWDGIGAVVGSHSDVRYLMGKVTLFPSYDAECRDLLLAYLSRYFSDCGHLVEPWQPYGVSAERMQLADGVFGDAAASAALPLLQRALRDRGCVLPPMFSAYLHLASQLFYFGSALNDEFSNSYEAGLLIPIAAIYPAKRSRYIPESINL